MAEQIVMDIGHKCADDVSAAMRRNMLLMADRREAMIVATYGAATAIAAATGATAAYMDGPVDLTAEIIDQVWASMLRPLILGELINGPGAVPETSQGM